MSIIRARMMRARTRCLLIQSTISWAAAKVHPGVLQVHLLGSAFPNSAARPVRTIASLEAFPTS